MSQQVLQPLDLGVEHPLKLVEGFIDNQAVLQHPRAMDDACDGTMNGSNVIDDGLNHFKITNISLIVIGVCSG